MFMVDFNEGFYHFQHDLELLGSMDITKFSVVDQMKVIIAYAELIAKVKPIYAKYIDSGDDDNSGKWIMKL